MKRRWFFQALTAFTAAVFLPPVRAAKALQRRVQRALPHWANGKRYWEHLAEPIPAPDYSHYVAHPAFRDYVPREENDAQIVCRVLGPTHFKTRVHPDDGSFERALQDAGWTPTAIERSIKGGRRDVTVQCAGCSRRLWLPVTEACDLEYGLWQVEHDGKGWVGHCPDHRGVA